MAVQNLPDADDDEAAIFAEINITPLTDIFLVLLIVFMVTSSVIATEGMTSGVRVDLPKAASQEVTPQGKMLVVGVTADGRVAYQGKLLEADELKAVLLGAFRDSPDTLVVIQADGGAYHKNVVLVMDTAKQVGLSRLAIATQSN